jgi:hypothetical protein
MPLRSFSEGGSFSHLFLKLFRVEILENLGFSRRGLCKAEPFAEPSAQLGEPEGNQENQDKRGENAPRDHNDFDSQFAHGGDVLVRVDVRIAVKESVTVAKNIHAA